MADAIVSIAVERLGEIIAENIREGFNLGKRVKKEVLHLSSELKAIMDVLEDAERRWLKEKSIQNWLNKLEQISYEVDGVLDEWDFEILKLQIEGSKNFVGPRPKVCSFIPCSCLCFKKAATRYNIAVKIKKIIERLDLTVEEKGKYNFTVGHVDPQESRTVESTSPVEAKEIRDRNDEKDSLVELILQDAGQESEPDVISIVGTGGIGKTAVAQLAYDDDRVKKHFELRIWICVSNVFDEARIAKGIVEIVKGKFPDVNGFEGLLKCVTNSISEKKFLLVLDDVWAENDSKWKPFKRSLKYSVPGSKILVTTRSEKVATVMDSIETLRLRLLSDEGCWQIMQLKAFKDRTEEECIALQDTGKSIAKKCKGLPLAATVLGGSLRFKRTVEEWKNVLNDKIEWQEEVEAGLFPHLLLSYNELSPAMKRCFLHCSIFPKDSEIDLKKLIRMWMVLGYLGSSGDLELRGKKYFETLRMRSFFQDVIVRNDKMLCKMHDILHDFAQFLTKKRSLNSEDCDGRVSQMKVNRSLFCCRKLPSEDLPDFETCLRVLSLCECQLEEIPANVANLIHLRYLDLSDNQLKLQALQPIYKLYNLRTLYLSSCRLKEVPRELGNLIQLRELDLSYNRDIKELPETICNLNELETLNLEGCASLSGLPQEIHRLKNLRHLLNDSTEDLCQIPQRFEQLTALRTLTMFSTKTGSNKLGYLKDLNQLSGYLELKIYLHDREDIMEAQKAELRNKENIKRLKILFFDRIAVGSAEDKALLKNEAMEALQPHRKLQHLTIEDFEGTKFPNWITSSLNHLKYLLISKCHYCLTLPPLGKLPCLEELELWGIYGLEFLNRDFLGISGNNDGSMPSSAVGSGFLMLKRLCFKECYRWKEWEDITAEEATDTALSIMPCLKELVIKACGLTALPHHLLRKASALENFCVENSFDLSERYKDQNGSDSEFLSHILHVQI